MCQTHVCLEYKLKLYGTFRFGGRDSVNFCCKMGRKIPARKHMGVRDPLKQSAERYALIKDKINNAPEKRDDQKVSHSLARFIKLKEAAAENAKNKKKKKNATKPIVDNEDRPENYKNKSKAKAQTTHRNDKEFENITQRENETDLAYLRRVNRITHESAQEAKFEAKYGVEVVRNKKTGEIKLKKKPTNEIDDRLKQNMENYKRAKKSGKPIDATEPAMVLSSEEKRKMVKKMMAEKKAAKTVAEPVKDFKKDEFKFGEVVHAPPTLTTPRRAQKAETVPRPGKKSLLLHSVLEENATAANENSAKTPAEKPKLSKNLKNIGSLKGKRKDMSMAMRYMIETEQTNVVKMYKEMKKKQRLENAAP